MTRHLPRASSTTFLLVEVEEKLCTRKGTCVLVCKHQLSAVTRGNEMHPSSVCIAGYGAPYGYSTAAPAYGTYSPVINKLENTQKFLCQSKCGSPSWLRVYNRNLRD